MGEQKRKHYRVAFPSAERPVLRTPEGEFDVLDLSEAGLRFIHRKHHSFRVGYRLFGYVEFHDGTKVEIDGSVLRSDDEENGHETVVLILASGFATDVIIRAQQWIIRRYPGFSGDRVLGDA